MRFQLKSSYHPTGDQPQAIEKLAKGIKDKNPLQVLLGVTGSGKTFTVANLIQKLQKPTLVISHNKTLAAQLYQEFRDFFPDNAVSYFVSYYDYYQPEAYIPRTDTYIEKETEVNEEIDKLRLLATTNLLTRKDVIVVASVSCIYNLGSPKDYSRSIIFLDQGGGIRREDLLDQLVTLQYQRSDYEFSRGSFRLRGDTLEIWPAYLNEGVKVIFLGDKIEKIFLFEPVSGKKIEEIKTSMVIYPAKHYLTNPETQKTAMLKIKTDLNSRLKVLKKENKLLELHRLQQRVNYDLEMIQEFGYVNGIENYSLYFDGRSPGEPPSTLLDYFYYCNPDYLTIVDESHITLPQIRGMYNGDQARKKTLIDYGFRLPSAIDNRPLKFEEFLRQTPQIICTSATPGDFEKTESAQIVEQLVRPTGLLDPKIDIRPSQGQVEDLILEISKRTAAKERVLVTTLTKRMAEDLSGYLQDKGIKVNYLHSDLLTLDRSDILDDLRLGNYDVLVGINLLREGLDLPEVSLVAILDADKEGFLRSETSLVQTMGRAARHQQGRVIMYADTITRSMRNAIREVNRRRDIQLDYNRRFGITPKSITKPVRQKLVNRQEQTTKNNLLKLGKNQVFDLNAFDQKSLTPNDKLKLAAQLRRRMNQAARELDFELAARLRDIIKSLI